MSERSLKRKTSPIDGQPQSKKNGFEERKHGEIWDFVLRHIRNAEDVTLDPPMNEVIRDGMVMWDKMKEQMETVLSAKDLYDMFHTVMLPNLAFADLSIQTKACLYYALQKPVDSEFQNQLHDVADYRLDDHNVLIAFRKKSPEEITIIDDPNDPWYSVWPDRNVENKPSSIEKVDKKKNPEEVFIVDDVDEDPEHQNLLVEKTPEHAITENSAEKNQEEQQNFFIDQSADKNPEEEVTEKVVENNPLGLNEIIFTKESGETVSETVDDAMEAFIRESFQSTSSSSLAIDAAFPLIDITDSDLEPLELTPPKTVKDALIENAPEQQDVSVDIATLTQQIIDDIADADDDEIVYIGSQPGTGKRSSFKKEGNASFGEEQNAMMKTPKTSPVHSLDSPRTPNARNQALSNVQALDSPMDVRPPNVREQVLNLERCLGNSEIKAAQDALRITELETKLQKSQDDYKIIHEHFMTQQLRISILETQNKEVNQRFDRIEKELHAIRSMANPSLELSTSSTSASFSCNSEPFVVSPINVLPKDQRAGSSNTNTPGYPTDDETTPPITRPKRIVPKGKPANAYEVPAKRGAPSKSKKTPQKSKGNSSKKEKENEENTPAPAIPKRTEVSKLNGYLGANGETPSRRRSIKTPIRFGI